MAAVPASISVTSLGGAGNGGTASGPSSASSSPSHSSRGGPGLYEFLIESELQHYYSGIRSDLKIQNVSQLKYVTEEDLLQIGMSKPEMRRLKKYFHKHFPQNYLSKFKKMILPRREEQSRSVLLLPDERMERPPVKVPNKHIIPAEAILVNKELGTGEFGVVQQGVWANDGERIQVAIKCLSRERMQNNPIEFLKEAAIMHAIDHEHIVRLYGVVLDTSSLMLVMYTGDILWWQVGVQYMLLQVTELAPLRSLLECLKEPSLRTSFPVLTLCDFAIQICDGMQYLEFKRLIHRDLAARNILVFSKNKVKISDFGLSRALGVGKDYYQTNFNVNLKLPIAWCAPECITFLRFTSASDVWAYGVTLWEMFSYGFQPWAALTGQQILEAIDEPNFQRLEQADCCPKDYYSIMLKCWQHDANKRPKFSDLMTLLPECKPEQVQAAQDCVDDFGKAKRDQLQFRIGDVITVLDKSPVPSTSNCWKGVLNSGKTGLFNPAFTVAYLGSNLPSTKSEFTRGDGKNTYSSKRRLRPDMISSPQGDLKHTGHVGLDGAYFGDISFLGGKSSSVQYSHLPRQVVSPYKPHEDTGASVSSNMGHISSIPILESGKLSTIHTRNPSDTSDRAPLLASKQSSSHRNSSASKSGRYLMDHEYHEISDEENGVESPRFEKSFDFGPSLVDEMDAMFKSLGSCKLPRAASPHPPPSPGPFAAVASTAGSHSLEDIDEPKDLSHNVRNEIREMAARVTGKKKQATVKPISAADQRTLESAIAMANELASRSMHELEGGSETSPPPESPHTPASPNKRKFSFKFAAGSNVKTSPKVERRNFAEEAASIPDIQSTLTDEARAAYNSLVEAPVDSSLTTAHETNDESCNPLRMLRSGVAVRPRIRGNKQRHTLERQQPAQANDWASSAFNSLPRPRTTPVMPPPPLTTPAPVNRPYGQRRPDVPPPIPPPPTGTLHQHNYYSGGSGHEDAEESSGGEEVTHIQDADEDEEPSEGNPIPVPPRDSKPILTNKPRHQRKHPLIIPGEGVTRTIAKMGSDIELGGNHSNVSPHTGTETVYAVEPMPSQFGDHSSLEMLISHQMPYHPTTMRHYLIDDSFENQIASELAALDNIPEEEPLVRLSQTVAPPPPLAVPEDDDDDDVVDGDEEALLRNDDHVSCEDLLEFACDGPNSRRTRGPAHGSLSDEVRIMGKVLGKDIKTSSEECVQALNATNWDVYRAIKVAKLQALLGECRPDMAVACEALSQCNWDVARAAEWVLADQDDSDTTEV